MMCDYPFLIMLCGSVALGITTAVLGVFMVFRKQSLLGDAISHAVLPGAALSLLYMSSAYTYLVMSAGIATGLCGAWLVDALYRYTILKRDAALGIVLSVSFSVGIVLLSIVTKTYPQQQAVIHALLFGNVSVMLRNDALMICGVSLVVLIVLASCFKELVLTSFDTVLATLHGYSVSLIDGILTMCIVSVVAVGLPVSGVVLMSSFFIAPVCAMWQYTQCLPWLLSGSALIGAMCAALATMISTSYAHVPTGPVAVVLLSGVVFVSMITRAVRYS